jgi:hypothetical protein
MSIVFYINGNRISCRVLFEEHDKIDRDALLAEKYTRYKVENWK